MQHAISRALLNAAPAQPPTEFRLFARGVNHTTKGDFIFDAAAAKSVMAAYQRQGVELPIDLEHQSLHDPASAARSDTSDARGWFKLALRNGELWATNVTWTPDGAARLANRTQRYTSPAFLHDADGRITEVVNCALVAMPATHNAQPVAASKYGAHNSKVLSARFPRDQIFRIERLASRRRISIADVVRLGVDQIARGDANLSLVSDLAVALGLSPDAEPEDVLSAVQELVDAIVEATGPTPDDDPSAEMADPVPPTPGSPTPPGPPKKNPALPAALSTTIGLRDSLTRFERQACQDAGIDPASFAVRKAGLARQLGVPLVQRRAAAVKQLSREELEGIKRLGITPEEYRARLESCVRRA
jgi:hypothetical protein